MSAHVGDTGAQESFKIEIENVPANLKSKVWDYFGYKVLVHHANRTREIIRDVVVCKLCRLEMKHTGSTTNLAFHLARKLYFIYLDHY